MKTKILKETYDKLIENDGINTKVFFHGTSSLLPFEKFNKSNIGSGIASISKQNYGGFFFTDEFENAAFYTEYLICECYINNILPNPTDLSSPPKIMELAIKNNSNYIIEDVLDGSTYSNIVVVPANNVSDININKWYLITDEDIYFERLDDFFDTDGEGYVDKYTIQDMVGMMGLDLNYLLQFEPFNKYYNSK